MTDANRKGKIYNPFSHEKIQDIPQYIRYECNRTCNNGTLCTPADGTLEQIT